MSRRAPVLRLGLTVLSLLALLIPGLAVAQDAVLEAELTYVGPGPGTSSIYRYDYTLTNNAVEPAIVELLVFFDSDPDSGVIFLGDNSDFNNSAPGFSGSIGNPVSWFGDVIEDPDPGAWLVDWFNPAGDARIFPGESLSGFSVTFLWKGEGIPGEQFFEAFDGFAHEGKSIITNVNFAPVQGVVTSQCDGTPLEGVVVDLYTTGGELVGSTFTGADGSYIFTDVPPGSYVVSLVTPIGYEEPGDRDVIAGTPTNVELVCLEVENAPRTIGFWKHQVNSHLSGKGKAQVPYAAFLSQLDAITTNFALSPVNPVEVYTTPTTATDTEKLDAAKTILTVNKKAPMNLRARQQLMAFLLNVASLRLGQNEPVSDDGATASQAITYAWSLIDDGISSNDERAKDIADIVNNGGSVPAGWIPLTTPNYAYEEPGLEIRGIGTETRLLQNFPNPVRAAGTDIRFNLAGTGSVRIDVFDVQGRLVRTLVDGVLGAGEATVHWDGRDTQGNATSSGLYFYRLTGDRETVTRKLIKAE